MGAFAEQRVRGGLVEARHPQIGQPGGLEGAERIVAGGEQQGDALGVNAPGDERQRVGAGAVQPLRVVDDAQHGSNHRRLCEQVQHGQRQQPSIGA